MHRVTQGAKTIMWNTFEHLANERAGLRKNRMTELLRTPLAFPRDFGEPLLLAVVSGGAGQTAVHALGHGLWVVVTARAGKLGSMPGACQGTPRVLVSNWV